MLETARTLTLFAKKKVTSMILVTTKTANVEQLNLPWRASLLPASLCVLFGRAAPTLTKCFFGLNYKALSLYRFNFFFNFIPILLIKFASVGV
jgi:hypothetical protein